MPLIAGSKLGPYEILGAIGAGGMGEVYRARDTRLDRTVAIKVLPERFSETADLRQRFEREARAISSLNHPHICTLHDVGHQDGIDYLVMEYIDGESLATRIDRGPLPIEQVLNIGMQVADALDKAHRSGIVHRDLKPGNVMLTKSGAKLLDFGLAKPAAVMKAVSSFAGMGMTQTSPASPITEKGSIVGTFQYMSPEQVEGHEADARSDIFALGAVLYEMVTGHRAFDGKSAISVASAILEKEPEPISTVQPLTPPALEHVVRTCLAKDPEERFQTAHDVKLQLRWVAEGGSQAGVAAPVAARRRHREWLAWAVAIIALVLGAAATYVWQKATAPQPLPIQSYLPAPENSTFALSDDDTAGPVVISHDGTQIAFIADTSGTKQIWVRKLSDDKAAPIAGTTDGTYPFWSPDDKWLGFFADEKLRKVPVGGGPVMDLADAPRGRGGSWGEAGILFAPTTQTGIFFVAAAGGTARQVTQVDPAHSTNRWPLWLPDGKHFLYLATNHANPGASSTNGIYVATLDGHSRFVLPAQSNAAVASGYLLYVQNGALIAQPFDAGRAQVRGDPLPVASSVVFNPGTWCGAFDVAEGGTLVYQAGAGNFGSQLEWIPPSGKGEPKVILSSRAGGGSAGSVADVRLSPDDKRLAMTMGDPQPVIWLLDLATGVRTRFTFEGVADSTPVWSPDGKRLAFSQRNRPTQPVDLYVKDATGSGGQQLLLSDSTNKTLDDWSPDGQSLLYHVSMPPEPSRIMVLPLVGDHKPRVLIQGTTPFQFFSPTFSKDGKWIAYVSRESGRPEVYITDFPQPHGKWQVSLNGGSSPRWTKDGKALLYLGGDRATIMEAPITFRGASVEVGEARTYMKVSAALPLFGFGNQYDIASDGRLLVNSNLGEDSRSITLVTNWTVALKK